MDSEGDRNAKIDFLVQLFKVTKWNSRWVAHRVPQAMLLLSNDLISHMTPVGPTMVAKDCSESCQKVSMWETRTHLFSLSRPHCMPGRQPCPTYLLGTRGAWQPSGPSLWSGPCPCSSHQGALGASLLTVPLCQRPRSPKQGAGLSRTEPENFKTKIFKDNRF